MPKVSVIIPLYNKGPYIRRAMDSVLAQSFKDFEIIVVDDGSTDNGPEIVSSYSDSRLRLVWQNNAGPGAARNLGVVESSAEYIAFLDADDEWLPSYLQRVSEVRKLHPNCEVIVTNWIAGFARHPKGLRDVNLSEYMKNTFGIHFSGKWQISNNIKISELRRITSRFCTPATSCTKDCFAQCNGFGTESKYGEDWLLWLNFIFSRSIYFIEDPLVKVHDEVSELWRGGCQNQILELYYYKYDDMQQACPKEYKHLLKKWYVLRALQSAHNRLSANKIDDVQYLLHNFKLLQFYTVWSFLKLRVKMILAASRR